MGERESLLGWVVLGMRSSISSSDEEDEADDEDEGSDDAMDNADAWTIEPGSRTDTLADSALK